jgi:DNA-binding MarR family transcriptional regulator
LQKEAAVFGFFTEVGIIHQLSSAALQKVLPDGVHPSHFSIINHLVVRGDGVSPVKIASAMQVTKATMTHSIQLLERKGFIKLAPSPDDGRAKLVFLTDAAHAFREAALLAMGKEMQRTFGPEDMEAMGRLRPELAKIREVLDAARD